ncbi:MAG: hypothetical protein ABSA83_12905 [Verrucomicrobiota bacterium]|jgi:hypothetical protein
MAYVMMDGRTQKVNVVSSILRRVQDTARQYVVALAGVSPEMESKVYGTGTIIERGGRVLLVTAEHVVSEIEWAGYQGVAFSNGDKKEYAIYPRIIKSPWFFQDHQCFQWFCASWMSQSYGADI